MMAYPHQGLLDLTGLEKKVLTPPEPSLTTAAAQVTGLTSLARAGDLFPRAPTIDDVRQRGLGDCVFLAMVMALLARPAGPAWVEGCMTRRPDGKVVVRLFDPETGDARYFAISNAFPHHQPASQSATVPLYAAGAVWASFLEKAFAASGFGHGESSYKGVFRPFFPNKAPTEVAWSTAEHVKERWVAAVLFGKKAVCTDLADSLPQVATTPTGDAARAVIQLLRFDREPVASVPGFVAPGSPNAGAAVLAAADDTFRADLIRELMRRCPYGPSVVDNFLSLSTPDTPMAEAARDLQVVPPGLPPTDLITLLAPKEGATPASVPSGAFELLAFDPARWSDTNLPARAGAVAARLSTKTRQTFAAAWTAAPRARYLRILAEWADNLRIEVVVGLLQARCLALQLSKPDLDAGCATLATVFRTKRSADTKALRPVEQALYDLVKAQLAIGGLLVCGTRGSQGLRRAERVAADPALLADPEIIAGLEVQHQYAVVGVDDDPAVGLVVVIENPHGNKARLYEIDVSSLRIIARGLATDSGRSRLMIQDFARRMGHLTVVTNTGVA